ncbi:hypothetical protein D9611_008398 [Ephemerocybe angulata]|uniref:HSF-type DNA-binding domain-containing protein n=1 Tax=Ephemerocybe angulata TaxID=980116 RepID=A0A8H5BI97_9AGAR|nr:hypothetical protein D9611_008398 [Tulosesus angulatus]
MEGQASQNYGRQLQQQQQAQQQQAQQQQVQAQVQAQVQQQQVHHQQQLQHQYSVGGYSIANTPITSGRSDYQLAAPGSSPDHYHHHQQQQHLYPHTHPPSLQPLPPLPPVHPHPVAPTAPSPTTTTTAAPQPASGASKRTTRASKSAAQPYQNIVPASVIKRERVDSSNAMSARDSKEGVAGSSAQHHDDPMPSTSDFVKKLYKMLEDPTFQSVVSWGPQGDCFVVKDMNEFTKSILPRMFKHSNFASFVRQLNKYDFHKVKNTDDNQFGEHSWTFRHPDFHADRRDALENIKRKVPAQRKSASSSLPSLPPNSSTSPTTLTSSSSAYPYPHPQNPNATVELQHEVRRLRDEGEDLRGRLRSLERSYENVLVEMVGFQRGMAQQDGVMQNLIAYFLGSESGKSLSNSSTSSGVSSSSATILSSSGLSGLSGSTHSGSLSALSSTSGSGNAGGAGAGAGEGYGRDAMDVDGGGARAGQYKLAPVYQGASGYVSY